MARAYGWRPQPHDDRDLVYEVRKPVALPSKVDLRPLCPPVYDQGSLGSCTANAIGSVFQYNQMQQNIPNWIPSRLFLYFNERAMEGTIKSDAGAYIRDGIKSTVKQGLCPEKMWPYAVHRFAEKPPIPCYKEALKHKAVTYSAIPRGNLTRMKEVLASGETFVYGFSVYLSFEADRVAKTGIVTMPIKGEPLIGGHAVKAVGYDDATRMFIVKNSWGNTWGDKGYFYFPYDYMGSENCSDFWVINTVK